MKIAGLVKNSFVDYPGNISTVVFTFGCPLSCYYCHNKHILDVQNLIEENVVFEYLNKRKNLVDAVVISGGEPTIQPDLENFIVKLKNFNLKIKLDTSGINPQIVKKLIEKKLVDYVAMDLKCLPKNYKKICKQDIDISNIEQTIKILINSDIDYEFRTTLVPEIDEIEFSKMLNLIFGAKNFYIQKCNFDNFTNIQNQQLKNNAEKFIKMAKTKVKFCGLRGFD